MPRDLKQSDPRSYIRPQLKWFEEGRKVKLNRGDIKDIHGCTKCGAKEIGDVWKCPVCGATKSFFCSWLGTKDYVTGDPNSNINPDFDKHFILVGEQCLET